MKRVKILLFAAIGFLLSAGISGCESKKPEVDIPQTHVHQLLFHEGNLPSCKYGGNLSYWQCSECGETFSDENGTEVLESWYLSALGHDIGEWETVRSATCVQTGFQIRTCSRCSYREENFYPITEHDYKHGYCTFCDRREYSKGDRENPDLYNSDKAFLALGEEENGAEMQALYARIDADARAFHIGNVDSKTLILGEYDYASLNIIEAVSVYKAFMDDHPLYYWLGRTIVPQLDYLPVPIDESFADGAVRAEINQVIYETAGKWREDTVGNAYLATLSYHDKIIKEINYAYDENNIPQSEIWAHTIVGVFTGRGAVCEGYARSFQLMLNLTGVQNYFVTGLSQNQPHAWNLVRLDDGNWYWYDLTYDDTPNWAWGVSYHYFCVNDTMKIDRYERGIYSGLFGHKQPENFLEAHTPDSGTDTSYLGNLPERSKTPYAGCSELLLRDTFKVGNFTYAVTGYHTVQLVLCNETGDVTVPETVEYKGTEYTVISIGPIQDGLFGNFYEEGVPNPYRVFINKVGTLTIPRTVCYIWEQGVPTYATEYAVAPENRHFTAVEGVLYTKDMGVLISYPKDMRTRFTIPDETIYVARYAFISSRDMRFEYPLEYISLGKNIQNLQLFVDGFGNDLSNFRIVGAESSFLNHFAALKEIAISEQNEKYRTDGKIVYSKNGETLYAAVKGITSVTIPKEVKTIESDAFSCCYELSSLQFDAESELTTIKEWAFNSCISLKEVVLPENVQIIERLAFGQCYALEKIVLPKGLKELAERVFWGSRALKEIAYGGSEAEWNEIQKDENWDEYMGDYTLVFKN